MGKYECDFLIQEGLKITKAIQVVHTLNAENMEREYNGLQEAMRTYNLNKGLLITSHIDDTYRIDDNSIEITEAWRWLLYD